MRTIAHIVNPVCVPPSSDLYAAQPVTFESMRAARRFAAERVAIKLFATGYPEDRAVMPAEFESTPDLDRSVLDLGTFTVPRKLPLLADILERLYAASDGCEYLVYSNVDIALMPSFYVTVDGLIEDGHDAFVINRRTISRQHVGLEQLGLMYAQIGERHPGFDCFIFPRPVYPRYSLARVCVGAAWVGRALALNMVVHARRFRVFADLHATFHLGDDRVHEAPELNDYRLHNRREMQLVVADVERDIGSLDDHPSILTHFPEGMARRLRGSRGALG